MEPIAEVALIANLFDRSNVSGLEFSTKGIIHTKSKPRSCLDVADCASWLSTSGPYGIPVEVTAISLTDKGFDSSTYPDG